MGKPGSCVGLALVELWMEELPVEELSYKGRDQARHSGAQ